MSQRGERLELRTILTADIQNFSAQMREDQEGIIRLLVDGYYTLVERQVSAQGGVLFRKEGDAIWCSFRSAVAAVRAAIGIQETLLLRNLSQSEGCRVELRVGVHLGDVVLTEDGEFLGHTLSVAKRLETACEEGAIAVSEEVHGQLTGRELGFDFIDRGILDLKGVGEQRVFQGSISPDRLAELMVSSGPSLAPLAGPRVLLAADLSTLADSERRLEWERETFRLARAMGSELLMGDDNLAFVLLDLAADLLSLFLDPALRGPRMVVATGEVLIQRREDGAIEGVFGEVVEDCLDALLGSGVESDVVLLTESVARSLGGNRQLQLEPAGEAAGPGRDPLYRVVASGHLASTLGRAHDPRVVGAWIGEKERVVDLAAGVQRGIREAAPEGVLGELWEALGELGGHWPRCAPVLSERSRAVLKDHPQVGLPLATSLIASMEMLPVPPRVMAYGAVGPAGEILPPDEEDIEALLPALEELAPVVVLSGWGAARFAPEGVRVVEFASLQQVQDWLRRAGRGTHVEALLRSAREGSLCTLVMGPAGVPEDLLSLGRLLASESEVASEGMDFYRLAEEAEEELGRDIVVRRFQEWASKRPASGVPGLLSRLAPTLLLYLFPDLRMERLEIEEGEGQVLALGGEVENPDSLVLSEVDLEGVMASLSDLPLEVRHVLARQPLLLLGATADDRVLRRFYRHLRMVVPAAPGQSTFLVTPRPRDIDVRWWERRGVHVITQGAPDLLERLITARDQGERAGRSLGVTAHRSRLAAPRSPYKFLDSFQAEDRSIFFGRDREMRDVLTRLVTHPLLVVYGRSGAGKTSLLQAGVLSRLPRPTNLSLTLRALSNPQQLIRRELLALSPRLECEGEEIPLVKLFEQVCSCLSGHLVVLLDQFEEFFVRLCAEERVEFIREVAALARKLPRRAHLVFCLREDFLAEMAEFEQYLPSILDNRYRLTLLTREEACKAIVGPAEIFGIHFEEELVEKLLDELEDEGVDPPQLQIVLDRLYTSRDPGEKLVTTKLYEELGGVRNILIGYLQSTLTEDFREDRELARSILRTMVTERGTKAVVDLAEMARRLHREPEELAPVMVRLTEARVIRAMGEVNERHYELAHEYLIQEVQSWDSDEEISLQHARMVLRSSLSNWQRFGSLLGPELLTIVSGERSHLEISREARAMLLRAASLGERPLGDWLEGGQAVADGVPILAGFLEEPEDEVSAAVKRTILEELFALPMGENEMNAMVTACQQVGNPSLLERLEIRVADHQRERLFEELQARVRQRFFGSERMVKVLAGPAILGSSRAEKDARIAVLRQDLHHRIETERPRQEVHLPSFWIDRCLVTNAEFAEFATDHVYRFPPEEADHPAVYVSWYDACKYAEWLGKELPDESQWEKAARGSDGRPYPWGEVWDPEKVNSAENDLRRTTAVDSYPEGASPYGCLGMVGNVWEWTASPWDSEGPFKVQKGGSTVSRRPHQHVATRFEGFPDFILQWVGFRTYTRKV
jgi:formylglycine-generating enzyme required for sulfatase activity/class 3 adenylate cyclase